MKSRFPVLALLVGSAAVLLTSHSAQAVPERLSQDAKDARARLAANSGGALVQRTREGSSFMSLRAGGSQPLMAASPATPATERARFFLSVYGAALGIHDPATQLGEQRVTTDVTGKQHVRMGQMHAGLPVFGGRLVVHMSDAGITGVGGVLIQGLDTVSPVAARELSALRAGALSYAGKLHRDARLSIASGRFVF